ncbi:MAG: cytidylate kinase-like family protein [Candidatus Eremiobacteraeota bacterium]|nr:cytidylate kinase-like family protein [Candidatus Eremiobacteraeota bacterium]
MRTRVSSELVRKQIDIWEREKLHKKRLETTEDAPYFPVVTVSRQMGTGGVSIAEFVAKKLNFRLFDREIIEFIAERADIRKSAVETIDEGVHSIVEEYLHSFMGKEGFSASEYLRHLTEVILVTAGHGKTVIIGRGAHLLIKNRPLLRVRIVCPLATRIRSLAERENHTLKKSEEIIKKRDVERASFIKKNFQRDIDDATSYDLVVNTDKIAFEQAADIIVCAYRNLFGDKGVALS